MNRMANKKTKTSSKRFLESLGARFSAWRSRRNTANPHRSFRRTRRRDYARPLSIEGYWAFTFLVLRFLRDNKKLFLTFTALYAVLSLLLLGLNSQEGFQTAKEELEASGGELFEGGIGQISRTGALVLSAAIGVATPALTAVQQVYAVILGLFGWLVVIWLARNVMAGAKVKLRDGLYNASSPIAALAVLVFVAVVQLIPVAIAGIIYGAAGTAGLLDGGVEAMLCWMVMGLLALISVYWLCPTFLAMAIVTLPGMYPFRALKIARDMILGRRLRIIYRLVWLLLTIIAAWVVVLAPVVLLDDLLKNFAPAVEWLPIVPVVVLLLNAVTLTWSATYVYQLYRKVVDNDAA